jgi:hypothetical protein
VRVGFVHLKRVARLLRNRDERPGRDVRRRFRRAVGRMKAAARQARSRGQAKLAAALEHFVKVSASYAPGLFHCYGVAALPRTNNDLEQLFGSHRYHERRCSGRKKGSPAAVVRGSVRLVAALATRLREARGEELAPRDVKQWRRQRELLQRRRDARTRQRRFRQGPAAYLRELESKFSQSRLPA